MKTKHRPKLTLKAAKAIAIQELGAAAGLTSHEINDALDGIPKDEEIVVLSMCDGIGTGRYCFDKLGYSKTEHDCMKHNIYAILAGLSLLLFYGTIGSIEWEQISIRQGVVQCLVFMALWVYFTYRAGLFYWQRKDDANIKSAHDGGNRQQGA